MDSRLTFRPSLFASIFLGGFECSTHRRRDGRRLDLIAGTRHDLLAAEDYRQLTEHGIRAARDGVRWHLIEIAPGRYDWSAVLPLLRAAEASGVRVVWDLCHYGWPDGLDVFSAAFVERFAHYAAAFARLHLEVTGRPAMVCPVNEISFLAWAGGDMRRLNPNCE
ncbi:MAG: beta-glucosidase, partial [Belnapia sp.]|nr:beta-glucosidase [Belnapia sp.]